MLQLTQPATYGGPTRRGHDFKARRHRGKHRVALLSTVDRLESTAEPTAERVMCPVCEKCYGAAVNYDYVKREDGVPQIVRRVGFCDGCELVFWWDQSCSGDGAPFGRPIKGSLVTNDKASTVETLLKLYPQLRGVLQI